LERIKKGTGKEYDENTIIQLKDKFHHIFGFEEESLNMLVDYYLKNKSMRKDMYQDYNTYIVQRDIKPDEQIPIIFSNIFLGEFDDVNPEITVDLFLNTYKKIAYSKDLKHFSNYPNIKSYFEEYILKMGMKPSEFVQFIGFCIIPSNRLLGFFFGEEFMNNDLAFKYNHTVKRWIEINVLSKKASGDLFIRNHAYISNKITPFILEVGRLSPERQILNSLTQGYMYRILNNNIKYKTFINHTRLLNYFTRFYGKLNMKYDEFYLKSTVDIIISGTKADENFPNLICKKLEERHKRIKNLREFSGKMHGKIFEIK